MTDKESAQHNSSSCQCKIDWQSIISHFQQTSLDEQKILCPTPCPAFLQVVEELIRVKAQLAQCQHLHFGRSSEKKATVIAATDKPEPASNAEDPCFPESEEPPVQKKPAPSKDQDPPGHEQDDDNTSKPSENVIPIKGRRGAKPGHKGHGRCIPTHLVRKEMYHPVPSDQRFCKICGKEGTALPRAFAEKSTQIDIKVVAELIIHYREKIKFGCSCHIGAHYVTVPELSLAVSNPEIDLQGVSEFPLTANNDGSDPVAAEEALQTGNTNLEHVLDQPVMPTSTPELAQGGARVRFVTAPEPLQAVNKSKLTHGSIALLIYLKYLLAIPLTRISVLLAACGFMLPPSSMACTFKHHMPLFKALYLKMAEVVKQMGHGNADETRWRSFYHRDGKENFLDWMWVFASEKVVLYVLDKSRSSAVPLKWLGAAIQAILNVDRALFYKKYARGVPGLVLAFCWAHFRRDFVRAAVGNALLRPWAKLWIGRIFRIYQLNTARLKALADSGAFAKTQAKLERAVNTMFQNIQAELKDPKLLPAQREVLESAVRHWDGLTVFVNDPMVPLDNNRAERLLRVVALARKNFYGTYSAWSGDFTAICLTILQTAVMHGLEPMAYIKYYLDVCAKTGGVPKDLEPHLPWNIPDAIRQEYGMSKKEQNQCA